MRQSSISAAGCEIEEMSCPLCASGRVAARRRLAAIIRSVFTRSTVATCRSCGLSFMSPLPHDSDLNGVYEEEYFQAYSGFGIAMPAQSELPPARYRERLRKVQQQTGVGELLEVGPGNGAFLNFAQQSGWRVIGIETSRYAAQQAATRYGLDIRCGTLATANLSDDSFHIVHMSHVLEHLTDPIGSLKAVYRKLKPGGALIIEVPNEFENLQFRILSSLRMVRPYPVRSTHVYFFTPVTLRRALQAAGFRVRHVATVRDLEGKAGLAQLFRRVAAWIERPLDLAPLIEAIAVKPA